MNIFSAYIRKLDWGIIIAAVLLCLFSFAGIYSTSVAKDSFSNLEKQVAFFFAGLLVMFLLSLFDYRIFKNNSYLILICYIVCILLLIGLYFFAPEIKGNRGWYKIGFLSLDPIEPTKIVLIILLAKYFSMRHVEMYKFRHIVFSGIYVAIPALIVFLKPDLGGTMVLISLWLGALFVSGIKLNHFLVLFLCFVLVVGMGWTFLLKDYQKQRVTSFLFPTDPLGSSWNQNQAQISVGSGGIFGQGLAKGSQVQYGFLPEPHTDFIFSVLAQEWGLVGIIAFFIVYGFFVWRVLLIAMHSASNFTRLFASGFATVLIAQFFINIGMNLGLLPVVGIFLPFISYGGSGLIGNFISLGILQSIKIRG